MKTRMLQRFIESFKIPLEESGGSDGICRSLDEVCQGLERFADKPVEEFVEFLDRARQYESNGQWPKQEPPISGRVVDMPSAEDYGARIRAFLEKEVAPDGPLSKEVVQELDKVKSALKAAQLKAIAKACGVTETISGAPKAMEKIFERITGRNMAEAIIETHQDSLQKAKHNVADLNARLAAVEKALNLTQIKSLAKKMGVEEKTKSKTDALGKIRERLLKSPATQDSECTKPDFSEEKIKRFMETLAALKEKASPPDAPYEEIDEELNRLTSEMNRSEAIEVSRRFCVVQTRSESEAKNRIREKVFEVRRAREKIRL